MNSSNKLGMKYCKIVWLKYEGNATSGNIIGKQIKTISICIAETGKKTRIASKKILAFTQDNLIGRVHRLRESQSFQSLK